MKYCTKCGTQLQENVVFCSNCGTLVGIETVRQERMSSDDCATTMEVTQNTYQNQQPTQNPGMGQMRKNETLDKLSDAFTKFNTTTDTTIEYDPKDIADNKVLALLSYLGILVIIPWFAAPNSKFARFHAKQGITLLAVQAIYFILQKVVSLIQVTKIAYTWGLPYEYKATPWFLTLLLSIIGIPIFVLTVIGIINAVTGKAKELPIIGKISLVK